MDNYRVRKATYQILFNPCTDRVPKHKSFKADIVCGKGWPADSLSVSEPRANNLERDGGWLAGTVGLTRQVFYPGRGGQELSQIADLLLQHVRARPSSTKTQTPYDKSLASLRTEIQLLRTQLRDADRALLRAAFREDIVRSGKILTL